MGSVIHRAQITEELTVWSNRLGYSITGLGIAVLAGWQFDFPLLKSLHPDLVAMNPLTAVCFIAASIAVVFFDKDITSKAKNFLYYFFALIPLCSGLLKLAETFYGFESGIDRFLFTNKLDINTADGIPNRMAPNTAFNFVLTGIALFVIHIEAKKKQALSQYLAFTIAFIGLLSVIGYIYSVKAFYGVLSYIPMAIHTALGFLLIALALLFQNSGKGIMRVFTSEFEGSQTARLLIPAAIGIPVLLGYLRMLGQWNDIYSAEFGEALLVIATISAFIGLIGYNSYLLNHRDKLRHSAEARITELNEELTQTNAQLAFVNKELEAFTYSVSHDLRAPLRSVIGYSNIMQEDYGKVLDAEGLNLLDYVSRNANKMNLLIDDLLAFSKIEKTEVKKTEIQMQVLIDSVWHELTQSRPHSAQLKTSDIHNVYGDRSLLQQVIINLLSNAIKYSSKKEKPVVTVSSRTKDNEIIFAVSDNGTGFDMQYAHKLFGVFQRLHKTADFEGTGVGLAIVQRIINKHDGKVWAESKPEEGATFYFTLPLQKKSSALNPAEINAKLLDTLVNHHPIR